MRRHVVEHACVLMTMDCSQLRQIAIAIKGVRLANDNLTVRHDHGIGRRLIVVAGVTFEASHHILAIVLNLRGMSWVSRCFIGTLSASVLLCKLVAHFSWRLGCVIAAGENRSAWLLMFHTRHLVEALRSHVEILDFKLLDTLTKDAIHLAHVDQFVVDFVDTATSWLLVHIGGLLGRGLIFTMLRRGCASVFRSAACTSSKLAMQGVAHFDFSLGLLREHAL